MRRLSGRSSAAAAVLLTVAFAGTLSANHQWGNYHWARRTSSFTLLAGDNLSSQWRTPYMDALTNWSTSTVLNVQYTPGQTKPRQCRPTAGRIEVCNASYGNTGWLGIAQIWASGDHITQGVAKMNDTYFNTATYNTPSWRKLVMCQEIAHDFGLDHQDENFNNPNLGTCMDYTSNPDGPPSNTAPNKHDYDELVTMYSHLDSTTTVGTAAVVSSQSASGGGETPGEWGRLARSSANGRVQIYELDLGEGRKVLTHVFWADPDADGRGR